MGCLGNDHYMLGVSSVYSNPNCRNWGEVTSVLTRSVVSRFNMCIIIVDNILGVSFEFLCE